jgi:hypothetical protein
MLGDSDIWGSIRLFRLAFFVARQADSIHVEYECTIGTMLTFSCANAQTSPLRKQRSSDISEPAVGQGVQTGRAIVARQKRGIRCEYRRVLGPSSPD